jgi:hypothetical protein
MQLQVLQARTRCCVHTDPVRRLVLALIVSLALAGLSACGSEDGHGDDDVATSELVDCDGMTMKECRGIDMTDLDGSELNGDAPTTPQTSPPEVPAGQNPTPLGPLTSPVIFDDVWFVEEGVWNITQYGGFAEHFERAFRGQANGLLGAGDRGALWITAPALYGKFRVRVELHHMQPPIPDWCEDVVEVSYRVGGRPLVMGGFEEWSEPMPVPAGDYRVRYCASQLDEAFASDEFDGDEFRIFPGRHLFQFWRAPLAPDAVVRQTSDFAASVVPKT